MKVRDALRLLTGLGAELREGGKHIVVRYGETQSSISRSGGRNATEVSPVTFAKLLSQLGVPRDDWPEGIVPQKKKPKAPPRQEVAKALQEIDAEPEVALPQPEPQPQPEPEVAINGHVEPEPEPEPAPPPAEPVDDTPVKESEMVVAKSLSTAALRAELHRRESKAAALLSERERLMAQVAKLDELLKELGVTSNGAAPRRAAPVSPGGSGRRKAGETLMDILLAETRVGGTYTTAGLATLAEKAGYVSRSASAMSMLVSTAISKSGDRYWKREQRGLYRRVS